jgi:hypothetical protein
MGSVFDKESEAIEIMTEHLIKGLKATNLTFQVLKNQLDKHSTSEGYISRLSFINSICPLLIDVEEFKKETNIFITKSNFKVNMSYYHQFIIEQFLRLIKDNEDEQNKSKLEAYLIPLINQKADKKERDIVFSEALYESLGNHKSISHFLDLIRNIMYFYTKQLYTKLIIETYDSEFKQELLDHQNIHFTNGNFNSKISLLVQPLVSKYDGDITILQIKKIEIFEFVSTNNISDMIGMVKKIKCEEKDQKKLDS